MSFIILLHDGLLAQLVEQLTLNQRVAGSIPAQPILPFYTIKCILRFMRRIVYPLL